MKSIRIFEKNSREYHLLSAAAEIMTVLSRNGYEYRVSETYFDYGQDWKWTTILCHRPGEGYQWDFQALCPRLQEQIVTAQSIEDLAAAIEGYFQSDNCLDRKGAHQVKGEYECT